MGGGQKDRLCEHLIKRYESWFGAKFERLLYDVTSTDIEGQAEGNEKAASSHSCDHRATARRCASGCCASPRGCP